MLSLPCLWHFWCSWPYTILADIYKMRKYPSREVTEKCALASGSIWGHGSSQVVSGDTGWPAAIFAHTFPPSRHLGMLPWPPLSLPLPVMLLYPSRQDKWSLYSLSVISSSNWIWGKTNKSSIHHIIKFMLHNLVSHLPFFPFSEFSFILFS